MSYTGVMGGDRLSCKSDLSGSKPVPPASPGQLLAVGSVAHRGDTGTSVSLSPL